MLLSRSNGATSVIVRAKLLDSSVTTGAGLTGLTSASSGLIISTIADVEATATTYTVAGSTVEAVTTLGTYAAPTATKCRFKEVDATNHKGVYEFQFADARFAVSGAKHLLVSILGATNLQQTDFVIDLSAGADVRSFGGTAGTFAAGRPEVNMTHIAGSAVSASTAQLGVNVVNFGGAAGTFASGVPAVSLTSAEETAVANKVWDTACSAHVTAGSFGQALGSSASGTAQAGASTTITLAAGASAVDNFYKYQVILITAGTGAGQGNIISGYVGSTKVATVTAWPVTPDATSVYVISRFGAVPGASAPTAAQNAAAVWDEARASHLTSGTYGQLLQAVRDSTAQSGTTSSITLDASASATNDIYKYSFVSVLSGTGAGQCRQITGYTGSSKVAAVGPNWTVAPDSTSVYIITPFGVDAATVAAIASAVWDQTRAAHTTAGSFGEYVLADAQRVAGNVTAATNVKSAFDGATGYNFVGSIMPSVTTVTGNVNGSVASVTGLTASDVGAIKTKTDFLPSAAAGTAGGVFIAGSNAATSITTALTANVVGNVTGNLSGSVGSVTGAVGSVTGAVGSVTGAVGGNLTGTIGGLSTQAKADVRAEAVGALVTDTYAEPSSVPAATASLKDKIGLMAALSRNKVTQTATTFALRNSTDSGNIATATVADDSTTATMSGLA